MVVIHSVRLQNYFAKHYGCAFAYIYTLGIPFSKAPPQKKNDKKK